MPLKEPLIYFTYLVTLITAIFAGASGFQAVLTRWWLLSAAVVVVLLMFCLPSMSPESLSLAPGTWFSVLVSGLVIGASLRSRRRKPPRQVQSARPEIRAAGRTPVSTSSTAAVESGSEAPMSAQGRAFIALMLIVGAFMLCWRAGTFLAEGDGVDFTLLAGACLLIGLGIHVSPWQAKQVGLPLGLAGALAFVLGRFFAA